MELNLSCRVTAQHISTQGLGFVAHGLACGTAYAFTLKPFLLYCGPNFLVVSFICYRLWKGS